MATYAPRRSAVSGAPDINQAIGNMRAQLDGPQGFSMRRRLKPPTMVAESKPVFANLPANLGPAPGGRPAVPAPRPGGPRLATGAPMIPGPGGAPNKPDVPDVAIGKDGGPGAEQNMAPPRYMEMAKRIGPQAAQARWEAFQKGELPGQQAAMEKLPGGPEFSTGGVGGTGPAMLPPGMGGGGGQWDDLIGGGGVTGSPGPGGVAAWSEEGPRASSPAELAAFERLKENAPWVGGGRPPIAAGPGGQNTPPWAQGPFDLRDVSYPGPGGGTGMDKPMPGGKPFDPNQIIGYGPGADPRLSTPPGAPGTPGAPNPAIQQRDQMIRQRLQQMMGQYGGLQF